MHITTTDAPITPRRSLRSTCRSTRCDGALNTYPTLPHTSYSVASSPHSVVSHTASVLSHQIHSHSPTTSPFHTFRYPLSTCRRQLHGHTTCRPVGPFLGSQHSVAHYSTTTETPVRRRVLNRTTRTWARSRAAVDGYTPVSPTACGDSPSTHCTTSHT